MGALIVNLFGGPGSGKSTGAAYIFSMLKMKGINAELVTEYVKDEVWEKNYTAIGYQPYVFGNQAFRIARCADKVDVVVTDSPTLLSIVYNPDPVLAPGLNRLVLDSFNSYNNISYFLKRTKPYNESGRMQTESEADSLSQLILDTLNKYRIPCRSVTGDLGGYNQIVDEVIAKVEKIAR